MKRLFVLLALCGAAVARAEDGISTDRPDFVESSEVVGPGRWQVETGFSVLRDRDGGLRTRGSSTPTLLRFGTGTTTELRLETDGYSRLRSSSEGGASERSSGFADLALGVKWHARDGDADAGTPSVAWLLHVDLPSGAKSLRGHGARPSLRVVGEWALPHGLSLGVMPGVMADVDEERRRFVSGILALTLARDLSARVHGFVEVAGQQLAAPRHGGNIVTFDTGLAVQLGDDWQWDVSLQKGLSAPAPDLQLGVGLSARF
jgi:hypothetical protein